MTDSQLAPAEQTELERHEEVIDRGLKTFNEVGAALLSIRDRRLYRAGYATFEAYCQQRWNIRRNYANKMIAAAGVLDNLGTNVPMLPANEAQARPLTRLDTPEQQRAAWQAALDATDGKPTKEAVEQAVQAVLEPDESPETDDMLDWYDARAFVERKYREGWVARNHIERAIETFEALPIWFQVGCIRLDEFNHEINLKLLELLESPTDKERRALRAIMLYMAVSGRVPPLDWSKRGEPEMKRNYAISRRMAGCTDDELHLYVLLHPTPQEAQEFYDLMGRHAEKMTEWWEFIGHDRASRMSDEARAKFLE